MKKILFLIMIYIYSVSSYGQIVIDSKFDPISFDEMARPIKHAQTAFERAIEQFELYYEKAYINYDKGVYTLAKYYLNRCVQINERFDGHIYSRKDLNEAIKICENEINKHKIAHNSSKISKNDFHQSNVKYTPCSNNNNCKIISTTLTSKNTIIEFEYINYYDKGGWCNIDSNTYIQDVVTGNRYKLIRSEGIPISPNKLNFNYKHERLKFKLIFPAIPAKSKLIDMFESLSSSWNFYNIYVR